MLLINLTKYRSLVISENAVQMSWDCYLLSMPVLKDDIYNLSQCCRNTSLCPFSVRAPWSRGRQNWGRNLDSPAQFAISTNNLHHLNSPWASRASLEWYLCSSKWTVAPGGMGTILHLGRRGVAFGYNQQSSSHAEFRPVQEGSALPHGRLRILYCCIYRHVRDS